MYCFCREKKLRRKAFTVYLRTPGKNQDWPQDTFSGWLETINSMVMSQCEEKTHIHYTSFFSPVLTLQQNRGGGGGGQNQRDRGQKDGAQGMEAMHLVVIGYSVPFLLKPFLMERSSSTTKHTSDCSSRSPFSDIWAWVDYKKTENS
jgi:hypothetical protein